MQVEEDPSSRFVDYTNATEFEELISTLEKVLNEWQLQDKGTGLHNTPPNQTHELEYEKQTYKLKYIRDQDATLMPSQSWKEGLKHFTPTMLSMLGNASRQFPPVPHQQTLETPSFNKWFGIQEFLLFGKATDQSDYLGTIDPSEAAMLLSAVTLALSSCNCTIPAFVTVNKPSKKAFIGNCMPGSAGSVSIRFETDSVPELSTNQGCISGLMDFFRLKLRLPVSEASPSKLILGDAEGEIIDVGAIDVSASFEYVWYNRHDQHEADDPLEDVHSKWRRSVCDPILPQVFGPRSADSWGPMQDPLKRLNLRLTWTNLREGSYVDNAVHSTLNPRDAPLWQIIPWYADVEVEDLVLARTVKKMLAAYSQTKELGSGALVSELATSRLDEAGQRSPSREEMQQIPAIRAASVVGNAIGALTQTIVHGTVRSNGSMIDEVLETLFHREQPDVPELEQKLLNHTIPVGQLVSLLTLKMTELPGINAMCSLWVEFVKELRRHWDESMMIPNMGIKDSVSLPDMSCSILHQKIQMLNYCIARRIEQRSRQDTSASSEKSFQDEEDEFFDSVETAQGHLCSGGVGRDHKLDGFVSISTKEILYKPFLQPPIPLTEDTVVLQQEILSRLGKSDEAMRIRHHMQSASLLSDMQSFKAANPGCVLADFVRWHSPKDWIPWDSLSSDERDELQGEGLKEEEQWTWPEHGVLTDRFRASGNLWHRIWNSAEPLAASDQRPIFNAAQEAEKVFHYLETLAPHEMFHQLLVGTLANSMWILRHASTNASKLNVIRTAVPLLAEAAQFAIRAFDEAFEAAQTFHNSSSKKGLEQSNHVSVAFVMAIDRMDKFISEVSDIERALAISTSLLYHLPEQYDLVNRIIIEQAQGKLRCEVLEEERQSICDLWKKTYLEIDERSTAAAPAVAASKSTSDSILGDPIRREYILVCLAERTFHAALRNYVDQQPRNPVVNRLYAGFDQDTVRFALALADTEF